jgi:hypothetical protein
VEGPLDRLGPGLLVLDKEALDLPRDRVPTASNRLIFYTIGEIALPHFAAKSVAEATGKVAICGLFKAGIG